jgi:hypothetical protein
MCVTKRQDLFVQIALLGAMFHPFFQSRHQGMYYIERWWEWCSCHCIDYSLVPCNFTLFSPKYRANNPVQNSLCSQTFQHKWFSLSRCRAVSRWSNSHPLQKLHDHSPSLSVSISTTLRKYRCVGALPLLSTVYHNVFLNSFYFHHVVWQTEIWCWTQFSPCSRLDFPWKLLQSTFCWQTYSLLYINKTKVESCVYHCTIQA